MKKVSVIFVLISLVLFTTSNAFAENSSIKFRGFDPTQIAPSDTPSPNAPSVPPTDQPPVENPGGSGCINRTYLGVAASELARRYLSQHIPNAGALAQQKVEEYHHAVIDKILYKSPWCSGMLVKAMVRVSKRMGIDFYTLLSTFEQASYNEIYQSTRRDASTPLYLWAEKPTTLHVSALQPMTQSDPPAINNSWTFTAYHSANPYLSYSLSTNTFAPPKRGTVSIFHDQLKVVLGEILERVKMPLEYRQSAFNSWIDKIPDANGYRIGVYSQTEAAAILPLTFNPHPTILSRLVLYVKPLVSSPASSSNLQLEILPKRQGLTVVDVGIVVDF